MSPKTRDIALIAMSATSIALLYRYIHLVGVVEKMRKDHADAVQQICTVYAISYRERINNVLDICVDSGMDGDNLNAVINITDGPLV